MKNLKNWNDLPLMLTAKHVSEILGLSLPLVYQLLNRASFPSIKVSDKRWVVPRDQLKLWLETEASGGR